MRTADSALFETRRRVRKHSKGEERAGVSNPHPDPQTVTTLTNGGGTLWGSHYVNPGGGMLPYAKLPPIATNVTGTGQHRPILERMTIDIFPLCNAKYGRKRSAILDTVYP